MSNQFPKQPKTIKVEKFDNYIIITKRWFDGINAYAITGFAFIWNSFIFFYLYVMAQLRIFLLTLPLSLIGIFLLYFALAYWINRTYIIADKKALVVRHKPLPWQGNTNFRVVKLENLYSKKSLKPSGHGQTETYFKLHAKANNGPDKKLLQVETYEEVLFIEKTLKDYLNIKDE